MSRLRHSDVIVQNVLIEKPINGVTGKVNRLCFCLIVLLSLIQTSVKEAQAGDSNVTVSAPIKKDLPSGKAVYTIQGKKDPRLNALFSATYISTSRSEACSQPHASTGTRKVNIGRNKYPITEENYRIEIPIYLPSHGNACGYRFSRIELLLRRIYDNELYSRHILLDRQSKVWPIYYGRKGGIRSDGRNPIMPAKLMTDKPHFRIAKQTQYICRTKFYRWNGNSAFYCFMQIGNGKEDSQFIYPTALSVATHPEFGIDDLSNEVLHVDMIADDMGSRAYTGKEALQDRFRTPPKPKPSDWERLKSIMHQLWEQL